MVEVAPFMLPLLNDQCGAIFPFAVIRVCHFIYSIPFWPLFIIFCPLNVTIAS
ncbi:hypothetical protein JCM18904_5268 [Vibrio sp. JCM 18904]|nr:hypothetical protein JCM18904_5268 [Vibrio sp. JCM 18904]